MKLLAKAAAAARTARFAGRGIPPLALRFGGNTHGVFLGKAVGFSTHSAVLPTVGDLRRVDDVIKDLREPSQV